jgi:hypothetical protein
LGGYDLTPTMKDVQRKFSVRYFLNLVLIDEEERRYFKQQVSLMSFLFYIEFLFFFKEIVLWRKQDKDKDKTKQSPKQYAHYESPNKTEDNGTDGTSGPLSQDNNSDTPSD